MKPERLYFHLLQTVEQEQPHVKQQYGFVFRLVFSILC